MCGAPAAASARFCSQCGSSLAFDTEFSSAAWTREEYRQVTVLFCDLVGSTSLSVNLPPEQLRDITRIYRETCFAVVRAHGGWISGVEGDGIIAYFGYPKASADNAIHACRAGLRLIAALDAQRPLGVRLRVRLGCATGLVVAPDATGRAAIGAHAITGTAPNVAARLQAIAPVGGLVTSQHTRTLLGAVFETQDLGMHTLKGIPAPVHVWRVVKERLVESRFAGRRDPRRTPTLIGRSGHLNLLLNAWSSARAGSGQAVFITGEAGIGKSRLVEALREAIAGQPCVTRVYQCSEAQSSSILHPVIAQVEYTANMTARDTPARKLLKLQGLFSAPGSDGELLVPRLAELMGIELPSFVSAPNLTPQQKRAATLGALVSHVDRLTEVGPVLMVVEDAQWIDPTTRELVALIAARAHSMRLLLVVTSRVDAVTGWFEPSRSAHLALSGLGHEDTVALVSSITAGKRLPPRWITTIAERTGGVPLFVEEFTKTVLDASGAGEEERDIGRTKDIRLLELPTTLRDCLMERLDQLPTGKDLLQVGAVLGDGFAYDLIATVCERDAEQLIGELHDLVDAGLLVLNERSPEPRFAFRHALIQEAAYESLLPRTRRHLHGRVAAVLRDAFPDQIEAAPELLARHLSGADAHVEATREWHRAGVTAAQRSATAEAALHFNKALASLKRSTAAPRDEQCELDILVRLAGALRASLSYASPDVARVCRRALKLARSVRNDIGELQALNGLYSFHLVRSEYGAAETRAHEMLLVAARAADPTYTMVAHRAVGAVSFHTGRLVTAEQSLELALKMYDKERHASLATVYGSDHAETCACFLSMTKWVRGAASDAIELQDWAVRHAASLKHAHSLAQAYAYRGFLYCLVGDGGRIRSDAQDALRIASANNLRLMRVFAECLLAVADAMQTVSPETTSALATAIDRLDDAAPKALRPFLLTIVADAHRRLRRFDQGLTTVDEADAIVRQTTERWAAAEVSRVRGALLADSGRIDLAERALRMAIQIARAQSADSWAARAVRDLTELLAADGRVAELGIAQPGL